MTCKHDFKIIISFADDEVYIKTEKCTRCGLEKTTEIDVKKYWDWGLDDENTNCISSH